MEITNQTQKNYYFKNGLQIDLFSYKNGYYFYNNIILKETKNSQGYSRVIIEGFIYKLHRLIALKYIPNIENKPIVDHINGIKSDNSINNLQWVTYSENSKKAYIQNPSMSNFKKSENRKIISEKNGIKTLHKSLRDCAKFVNRDVAAVYRVLKGEWNFCNGYKLIYIL